MFDLQSFYCLNRGKTLEQALRIRAQVISQRRGHNEFEESVCHLAIELIEGYETELRFLEISVHAGYI